MPSTRRLAQQGSAVVLASFLAISSSRAAAGKPSAREVAKRWRERPPMRLEELRQAWRDRREADVPWKRGRTRAAERPRGLADGIAPRFHAGGLPVREPRPVNPLLDPLGIFEDEAGEEPPVGPLPRLFLADFDGDGDLDVFVGDKYGYVRYLRNEAGPGEDPVYVELTGADSPTGALDLSLDDEDAGDTSPHGSSAPTLVDIDGDADLDLFVGQGYYASGSSPGGRVLFFENDGSGNLARNDDDNPLAGFVFGEAGATPTFVDIDEDGDFDAFVGTKIVEGPPVEGEVFFLRNDGSPSAPAFVDQTGVAGSDPFGDVAFQPFTAPYFADVDGDGDPDGWIGSLYTTRFFRNDSVLPVPPVFVEETGYEHPLASSIIPFPGPVLADVDGDGDLDAFVGLGYYKSYDVGFIQYFENTGSPNDPGFLAPGDRLELVDVDGDGDLDALVSRFGPGESPEDLTLRSAAPVAAKAEPGETFGAWYFRNVGTQSEPSWQLQTGSANPFFAFNSGYTPSGYGSGVPSLAPTVGHLDGDALLDAFVGLPSGYLEYLEDDGTGQLDPAATHPLESFDFEGEADPHLADVDGDGELDLVVGYVPYDAIEGYGSRVAFFLNPPGPDGLEAPPDTVLDFTDVLERPAPTLADVDGDGDLDLLVGGYHIYDDSYSYGVTLFVENTGTPTAPAFDASSVAAVEVLIQGPTSPAMGDVNGDGLLDLYLGNLAGAEAFLTSAPALEVTKAVSGGTLEPGGTVEYTLTVTNVGTGTQPDDADDPELTDTLPEELTLLSATVVSGPGSVDVDLGANSLRFDGSLAPGDSSVLVVTAQIDLGTGGQTIENQAVAFFDNDEDGENDSEGPSDDPATGELEGDPTAFVVRQAILEIPTLSQWGAALFAGLLSLLGLFGLRRFNA